MQQLPLEPSAWRLSAPWAPLLSHQSSQGACISALTALHSPLFLVTFLLSHSIEKLVQGNPWNRRLYEGLESGQNLKSAVLRKSHSTKALVYLELSQLLSVLPSPRGSEDRGAATSRAWLSAWYQYSICSDLDSWQWKWGEAGSERLLSFAFPYSLKSV